MTVLQRQAKALGEPTRYRIFGLIAEATEPPTVNDLTDALGVTHNAVRKHLAHLVTAGLVYETQYPAEGRGRPPVRYGVTAAATRWAAVGPYERLSSWLAEVVRSGDDPIEVGRRIGRRDHVGYHGQAPVRRLVAEMERQGFEPEVTESAADTTQVDIALRHCPFESAAAADQATVCGLHRGIIEGTAASIGQLAVDNLVVSHPGDHNCHIQCHHEPGPL